MITDYYGTQIEVQVVGASPGLVVDIDRRSTQAHRERDTGAEDFDRLTPEQAIQLAIELLNAAQQADPHGCALVYLSKFEEMSREHRY